MDDPNWLLSNQPMRSPIRLRPGFPLATEFFHHWIKQVMFFPAQNQSELASALLKGVIEKQKMHRFNLTQII